VRYRNLRSVRKGAVARIVLDRPERRNALSLELLDELTAALQDQAAAPQVAAVVIEGAGPVFSAGHDLSEMVGRESDFYAELFSACTQAMLIMQRLPQPVIAKVHGVATAAGCQLVAASDVAVAAAGTRFATPGVKIGLFCSTPMVPIARAIGRKRALEMLFTGEAIDAETACDWGLINRVVPAAALEAEVGRLVGQITRHSKEVVALGKEAFYRQIDEPEAQAYRITEPIMADNAIRRDAQEGIKAFLEKRPPRWGS
jgi:enoyl-CoA hydratase/carnithine racemase